ncbi:MAG: T9SS type A sorting domain-containing protein [Bacteroidales bacterium]|nr:T9SS type A sorting domain-containing protein [Bacteroidales bacterium]
MEPDESPYLSDTVMKSAIYKENVLPNAMLRDILVANPQSAKSTEILDEINERFDPMPDEMMGEILQGRNIDGELEILEAKMAKHVAAKYESLYKLESLYKQDTLDFLGSMDSLISLWSGETDPEILYRLAFLYFYNNDSLNCFNTLEMIPQLTNLTIEQTQDYEDYNFLMEILWPLKQGNDILDSLMVEQLTELKSRESKPGSLARNVLVANGITDYIEPIYLSDNLKSSLIIPDKHGNSKQKDNRLSIFPNPAKDYIIVSYDLSGKAGNPWIDIYSLEGKPCYRQSLIGSKNQIVIPMAKLASGVYSVQLVMDGEILESSKFVLINE